MRGVLHPEGRVTLITRSCAFHLGLVDGNGRAKDFHARKGLNGVARTTRVQGQDEDCAVIHLDYRANSITVGPIDAAVVDLQQDPGWDLLMCNDEIKLIFV